MEAKEFQKKCADLVEKMDDKFGVERNPQLSFTQMVEEIGELAKDINLKQLRKKDPDMENLSGEFADVFMQLSALARMYGVDLEEAVENKVKVLKNRGYID